MSELLSGKKTYGSAIVAFGGATVAFMQQYIHWTQLVSVGLAAITVIMFRIAFAGNRKILLENQKLLETLSRKK